MHKNLAGVFFSTKWYKKCCISARQLKQLPKLPILPIFNAMIPGSKFNAKGKITSPPTNVYAPRQTEKAIGTLD
jgi:hypothetical protein